MHMLAPDCVVSVSACMPPLTSGCISSDPCPGRWTRQMLSAPNAAMTTPFPSLPPAQSQLLTVSLLTEVRIGFQQSQGSWFELFATLFQILFSPFLSLFSHYLCLKSRWIQYWRCLLEWGRDLILFSLSFSVWEREANCYQPATYDELQPCLLF